MVKQKETAPIPQNEALTDVQSHQLTFYIQYSLQDLTRRKAMYCIAFVAVFVSILAILLIDVFVKKGSLIFVKMSEDL